MRYPLAHAAAVAATIAVTALGLAAAASPAAAAPAPGTPAANPPAHQANVRDACPAAAPGRARCFAEVRTDVHGGFGVRGRAALAAGHPAAAALPPGYGPADLRSAYNLPAVGGSGQTVVAVDAGDDAAAEADLDVYRSTYGLPACTTADGCFRKVNESGVAAPLPSDQGWGLEISLDLDMVSAACPSCHILLVEANIPSFADLAAAENTAVALGATEVSNSYGATEQNGMQAYQAAYAHPGVAIVASSGDSSYGIPNFPAVFPAVISAGGTTLTRAANARGWTESAWAYGASGCSAWVGKPAWQHDPNCPGRMVADVAADADPETGPAVYDANDGYGWLMVGGTSASSPYIAGVIALAGHPAAFPNASYLYSHASALNDITSGSNDPYNPSCGGDYECNAVPGYDGPTGNGTPDGLGAF
jgi:subtilase family serine protease